MGDTITINISELDAEIQENDRQISLLEKKNEELLQVKAYLLKMAQKPVTNNSLPPAPPDLGVSHYILWYLEYVKETTAEALSTAWAYYSNQDVEDVRTQISNSLNRLKNELKKVDSRPIGIGKKDGYYWFKL